MARTITLVDVKASDLKPGMRIGCARRRVVDVKPIRRRPGWVYVQAVGGRGLEGRAYRASQAVQAENA